MDPAGRQVICPCPRDSQLWPGAGLSRPARTCSRIPTLFVLLCSALSLATLWNLFAGHADAQRAEATAPLDRAGASFFPSLVLALYAFRHTRAVKMCKVLSLRQVLFVHV